MTTEFKRELRGMLIGAASIVLAGLIGWLVLQPLDRLSSVEKEIQAIRVDIVGFRTEHTDLKNEVESQHKEIMEALKAISEKADAAATASAVALEVLRRSMVNEELRPLDPASHPAHPKKETK